MRGQRFIQDLQSTKAFYVGHGPFSRYHSQIFFRDSYTHSWKEIPFVEMWQSLTARGSARLLAAVVTVKHVKAVNLLISMVPNSTKSFTRSVRQKALSFAGSSTSTHLHKSGDFSKITIDHANQIGCSPRIARHLLVAACSRYAPLTR